MKFLLTYSSLKEEKIIEIKSLKDLFNLAKKEDRCLIIDFGGEYLSFGFKKKHKDLDGIIEVYDRYRE